MQNDRVTILKITDLRWELTSAVCLQSAVMTTHTEQKGHSVLGAVSEGGMVSLGVGLFPKVLHAEERMRDMQAEVTTWAKAWRPPQRPLRAPEGLQAAGT